MTELESARERLAEAKLRSPVFIGDEDVVKVPTEEYFWLCGQLSGFLEGETVNSLEKAFSDLVSLKERNDKFLYQESSGRIKLQGTVKRLEAKLAMTELAWVLVSKERDHLREQLADVVKQRDALAAALRKLTREPIVSIMGNPSFYLCKVCEYSGDTPETINHFRCAWLEGKILLAGRPAPPEEVKNG